MAVIYESLGQCQSFFLLDSNHLLSISHVRYEERLRVPIFVLVQQPSMTLEYPYDSNPNAFALVLKEKDKYTTTAYSLAFESCSLKKSSGNPSVQPSPARPSPSGVKRVITDALPVSFRFPGKDELEGAEIQEQWTGNFIIEEVAKVKASELDKLTKFDRQRGWYEEVKDRPSGTVKDKFYKHLKSNVKCRSKIEVYYFIETGKRPTHGSTRAMIDEMNKIDGGSKITRGSSLLEMKEVGHYDEEAQKIYRRPIMPTGRQPMTSENAKRGTKKRKREEGIEAQGQNSEDTKSNLSKPNIYTLYDFQTLL